MTLLETGMGLRENSSLAIEAAPVREMELVGRTGSLLTSLLARLHS